MEFIHIMNYLYEMQIEWSEHNIENIELLSKQLVEGFIIGLHKSPFHGFSVEFAEHRLYNTGDNLKHVDWKVFGKKETMFVKKYEEETNLRCCIAIDQSGSMHFSNEQTTKLQYATVAAACILQLLQKQLDASAIALFSDKLDELTNFGATKRHTKALFATLNNIVKTNYTDKQTAFAKSIHELAERLPKRSLVVIFSDFPYSEIDTNGIYEALHHLKFNKHEVILFHLQEKNNEIEFNFENRAYEFIDMESGEKLLLNPAQIQEKYRAQMMSYQKKLEEFCINNRIDLIPCDMSTNITFVLQQYLQKRSKLM